MSGKAVITLSIQDKKQKIDCIVRRPAAIKNVVYLFFTPHAFPGLFLNRLKSISA